MLPTTRTDTHVLISICTPQKAYPRLYDAILSTKYFDDESELAYYGYRYYSPELGRFISRDPIGELDISLYSFTQNNVINSYDPTGQAQTSTANSNSQQGNNYYIDITMDASGDFVLEVVDDTSSQLQTYLNVGAG